MERGEIASEEQFLLSSTIFCYLVLDSYVKTRIRFSLRDKRLFEITEVEIITRVDCSCVYVPVCPSVCLPILILSVCVSVRLCVRPSARLYAYFYVILFLYRFVCFLSLHSSVRSSVRLIVFCQYECMHVSLLSVYMTMTYPISNFLLPASYF